ncbi:MAG: right-handed parallel beta-helix repeat-containing protein [candidate division WOR-3 bacterium]|nr:MAG: right-handed parallel beta-helix repeat-containing protein [candidate division WOR-3 bacterium]
MMKRFFRGAMVLLPCLFCISRATIFYVHPDSSLNSIQVALDLCATGDTVLVAPGIYRESITWPYIQGVQLLSESGADTTIIDGGGNGSVIHLSLMAGDSATVIQGFTIRSGNAWLGGGIYCVGGRPLITGNIITGNVADWPIDCMVPLLDCRTGPPPQGGGIYTEWSSAVITDNIISNNNALQNGGGIACFCDAANISPLILNNMITGNTAHNGGGLYIDCPFTLTEVRENMISGNAAICGGGVACYYAFMPLLKIVRNLITGNVADSAGGGIWCYLASSPLIDSCTITGNTGDGIYSGYFSSPIVSWNDITDNLGFGIRNDDPTYPVIAENNWWGDASGPYHPTTNPGGTGDTVSDYVDFEPWLTMPGVSASTAQSRPASVLKIYPNPVVNSVWIRYSISEVVNSRPNAVVSMKIYDSAGRLVKSLEPVSSGENQESSVYWNGTDCLGRTLPSGVYLVKFETEHYTETEKIVLLRQ